MIGIIVNPNAHGLVRDTGLPDRLRAILGDQGEVISTRSPDELKDALAGFRRAGLSVLGTCGGDGTNLYAFTELCRAYAGAPLPAVAILRGGTVNTIANCLGVRGTPEAILGRLMDAGRRSPDPTRAFDRQTCPFVERNLLQVNGLQGFLYGSGLAGRFFEAYYAGSLVGLPMAALLIGRTFASAMMGGPLARRLFEPMTAELVVDGRSLGTGRFTLLLASTLVRDVAFGIKVLHAAGTVEGTMHLLASEMPPRRMAAQFHRPFFARPLQGEGHHDLVAREVEIRLPRPQPYLVDGDLFRAGHVKLAAGPRLRILCP
jgi:hypothetical protein